MAIKTYTDENGQKFYQVYVNYRSPIDRTKRVQRYSSRLKTEAEARREERKLTEEAARELQRLDGRGILWLDVLNKWEMEVKAGYLRNISERSLYDYIGSVHKWTVPWMKKACSELTKADGRDLIIRLERAGLSRTYQKKVKNTINQIFEWGVEFGLIKGAPNSPVRGLMVQKIEETPPDILTLEEIKKFLTAAKALSHRWYPIWSFAILTGMRSGELHALTWDQIDLEKGTIMVDRSYDSNLGKTGSTKGRYWRTVPINDSLRALIVELKSNRPDGEAGRFVLPRIKDWDNGDQAVSLKNFLKSIKVKPVKFHALRACFATQMLANGVPAPVVMKIGGWKKSSTMDIYLRLAGVDIKGATDCLEFVPSDISFGGNVINLFDAKRGEN